MWIAWLARWKTQYEHVQSTRGWNKKYFSSQPLIFFALMFFLYVVGLLSCLLYFLLFALWCNFMPNILFVAHSCCFLKCLYVVAICQQITAISDQCQAKKHLKKMCFIWPTYPTWKKDMKPETHIFYNVQNRSEKCRPIGNVKIWLELFYLNQVNMLLNLILSFLIF
jgi:hypothetical protein